MYAVFPRHVFFQEPFAQSSSRVDLVCNQKWSFQIRLRPGSASGKQELGTVPDLYLVSAVALQNPESFRISISIPVSGICESSGVLNTWLTFPLRTHRLFTHQQSLSMLPPLQHPSEPWLPYIVGSHGWMRIRVGLSESLGPFLSLWCIRALEEELHSAQQVKCYWYLYWWYVFPCRDIF